MKVWLEKHEWYPVFDWQTKLPYAGAEIYRRRVELPPDLAERYEAAMSEFEEVQRLFGELWDQAAT